MNFRAPPKHDGAGHRARRLRKAPAKSGVLSIKPFRRLWIALSLSSLGDWLSILALTALAAELTGKHTAGQSTAGAMATQSAAVGGVWLATLLPALLLGPLAGAIADRLDRRMTMIIGDVVRGLLFLSIPLFPNLTWIYIAKFLAGCASLFWNPATAASIPNLVPKDKLERANQLSLLTTYGTAPVAAGLFSVLALVSEALGRISPYFKTNNVDLALYINAASYAVSALTIFMPSARSRSGSISGKISVPSAAKSIWEGWRLIGQTPVLRGLSLGMVGAFTGAGVVVGLGYSYITYTLHGGSAGWGLVFAAHVRRARGRHGPGFPPAEGLQPAAAVRHRDRRRGGAARPDRPHPEPHHRHPAGRGHRRAGGRRLRDRLHDRRPGGGRRHPGPDVRVLPVVHPDHPLRGDRRRGLPLHRFHEADLQPDRLRQREGRPRRLRLGGAECGPAARGAGGGGLRPYRLPVHGRPQGRPAARGPGRGDPG